MGNHLMAGLRTLQDAYPRLVREVRGRGLMVGVELTDPRMGAMLTVLLANHSVLALFANNRPTTMIVMPPLIISREEVDEVLVAFVKSFAVMAHQLGGG
jgi:putrescine aminotransferase